VSQESRFSFQTAGEAGEFAICSDNSMARHDNGQRVSGIRRAYCPASFGRADRFRQVQVTPGLTVGNFFQRAPDFVFKIAAARFQWQVEASPRAREVFAELSFRLKQNRVARLQFHGALLLPIAAFPFPFDGDQRFGAGDDLQFADR